MPTDLSPLGQAALAYAVHGWFILPPRPRDKWPWTGHRAFQAPKGEGGFKLATRNLDHIREAWTSEPQCNIGVRPGPSGLLVIDSDGDEGEATLAPLELTPTLTARTGRPDGGLHRYYRSPGAGIEGDLGPGTTVRHFGGLIVLPPSIHPSGQPYRWINRDTAIAPCPDFVLDRLRPAQHAPDDRRPAQAVLGNIPSGARNETLTSFAGSMRRRGMSEQAIVAALRVENATRCRPPLPAHEVERIAESVARYNPAAVPALAQSSVPRHLPRRRGEESVADYARRKRLWQ